MPLITLTTDWGIKDPYVGALKGSILKECSNAQFVDISHFIPPHNIIQAAYIFKFGIKNFPQGTIHIIGVENNAKGLAPMLIIRHDNQYFLGPDSGLFSIIFPDLPDDIVRIKTSLELRKSNTPYILARTAAYIANGGDMYQVGEKIDAYQKRFFPLALIEGNFVRATVIYIDNFGNVVLNIDAPGFNTISQNRPFSILLKNYSIFQEKLYLHYSEVVDGEAISIINSGGMIEIAINNGNASQLIGIKTGDIIRLEFHDH